MDLKELKILYIEDDFEDVVYFKEMLNLSDIIAGKQLTICGRMEQAYKELEMRSFDIIFLDLNLPDSRGVETFHQIYQISSNIPIIIMSGLDDLEMAILLVKEGAQDYLHKGEFDDAILKRSIVYAIERKKLENTIKQSDADHRALFENIQNSFSLYEIITNEDDEPIDYIFREVNRSFELHTGLNRDSILGKKISDIFPDIRESSIDWVNLYGDVALNNKKIQFEYYSNRSDKWYSITAYSPKPNFFATIVEDITKQKEAKIKLKESEEKFRVLAHTLPTAIMIYQNDYWVYANEMATTISGYSNEELLKMKFWEFVHPEYKGLVIDQGKNRQSGTSSKDSYEMKISCKDGTEKWVKLFGETTLHQDKPAAMITVMDIDKLKGIQFELEESNDRFKFLSQATFEGIVIHVDGIIINANDSFMKMTGYPREEVIGENLLDYIVKNEDKKNIVERLVQVVAKPYTILARKKDGTDFIAELEAKNVKYNGQIVRIVAVRDVTERKRSEEKIKNLLKEKEILLKEVHHRIKNNMTTIESLIRIHRNSIDDELSQTVLLEAENRIKSMRVLYEKLFKSKNFQKINTLDYLTTLINEVLSVFPQGKNIRLEKDIEDFPIDANLVFPLGIIINELITNSMKYAFSDSKNNLIFISAKKTDNHAEIVVRDNGIGLADDLDLKKSTGFGLKLVNMLLQQLGATYTIEVNNGTKFSIDFLLKN